MQEPSASAPPLPARPGPDPKLDLRHYIAVYDEVLSPELCQQIIDNFHALGARHTSNGAGVREGLDDSSWTELDVTAHADLAFKRHFEAVIAAHFEHYNANLGLQRPISPVQKLSELRLKWYRAERQDRFQIHFDSIRAHSNRYLVFLWYLNDVASGGETWFPDLGVHVQPRAGRLLIFPPFWMFQHAALPPQSNDKYILSTYVLY